VLFEMTRRGRKAPVLTLAEKGPRNVSTSQMTKTLRLTCLVGIPHSQCLRAEGLVCRQSRRVRPGIFGDCNFGVSMRSALHLGKTHN
jgi:hypothetical protein